MSSERLVVYNLALHQCTFIYLYIIFWRGRMALELRGYIRNLEISL